MRDPRILLGCVSALIIILGFACAVAAQPEGAADRELRIALGFSLAVFLAPMHCGRNSGPLSLSRHPRGLSGVLLLAALPVLLGARSRPWLMSGLFALVVIRALRTTVFRGGAASRVVLRPFPSNCRRSSRTRWFSFSILSPTPSLCPRCRFRRARSASTTISFIPAVGQALEHHRGGCPRSSGPLWGVEDPHDSPGVADASLASLGLARDECVALITNMEAGSTSGLQAAAR